VTSWFPSRLYRVWRPSRKNVYVSPRASSFLTRPLSGMRGLVGEQLLVTGAQLVSGVGNLAFVVVADRVLSPRGFAQLVGFLALYLVVHMPTGSISAASTLVPQRAPGLRRRLLLPVLVLAAVVALSAPWTAPLLRLPSGMLILTAITVVVAPFLSLERGPLHAWSMNGRVSLTLVVEPVVRLAIGIPLAIAFGAVGGAAGVVLAGYAAWLVAAIRRPGDPRGTWLSGDGGGSTRVGTGSAFWWTGAAFLFLALFQKQDVLFANRLLDAMDAATFAAVATLGGAAVLGSVRVPLVLIPRAVQGSRKALGVALSLAAGLGLGAVAIVAIFPDIVTAVFPDYERAAGFAVPYMTAMALLAVSRVLVAYFSATGHPRAVAGLVGSALALHVVLLVAMGTSSGGIVRATLIANLALIVVVSARAVAGRGDQQQGTSGQTETSRVEMAEVFSQDPSDAGQQDQDSPQGNPEQEA
jgi:O-antigen/teichoic acid export membrane protein